MKSFIAAIVAALALESQAVFLMDGDSAAGEKTSLDQLGASIEDGSCKTTTIELPEGEEGVSCAIDIDADAGKLTVVTAAEDDDADEEKEDCGCGCCDQAEEASDAEDSCSDCEGEE